MGTAEAGHIVSQIFRIGIGFVGVLLFLVDDDHSHISQRCKHRGSCADDHIGEAVPDTPPGVVSLTGGEGRVDDCHPLAVSCQEYAHHLRR